MTHLVLYGFKRVLPAIMSEIKQKHPLTTSCCRLWNLKSFADFFMTPYTISKVKYPLKPVPPPPSPPTPTALNRILNFYDPRQCVS